jgi:hypothetical protein
MSLIVNEELKLCRVNNENPYFPLYFIFYQNREIGHFNYLIIQKTLLLYQFELGEQYRNLRLGTKIVEYLESFFRWKGFVEFEVIVLKEALEFWKKRGFNITEYKKDHFIGTKHL